MVSNAASDSEMRLRFDKVGPLELCPQACIVFEQGKVILANRDAGALLQTSPQSLRKRLASDIFADSAFEETGVPFSPDDLKCRSFKRLHLKGNAETREVCACAKTVFEEDHKKTISVLLEDPVQKAGRRECERAHQEMISKREAEALVQQRQLLDYSSDMLAIMAPDGTITYVSSACKTILGYGPEEMVGKAVTEWVHPDHHQQIHELLKSWRDGTAVEDTGSTEYINRRRDGTPFPLESSYHLVRSEQDKTVRAIVWVCRDATTKKSQEVAEHKIRELEATRMGLALFVHDLRNLLNLITVPLSIVQETDLILEQRTFIQTACCCSDYVSTLCESYLSFYKLLLGQLESVQTPFNLKATFEDVARIFSTVSGSKTVKLEVQIDECLPLNVIGDKACLKQVIFNLLGNAFKFTDKGFVRLSVTASTKEPLSHRIQFEVADSGPGIPLEKQVELFRPFGKLSPNAYEGTGLGLWMSGMLVNKMGGDIQVQSEPGKGAKFAFALPLSECAPSSVVQEAIPLQWNNCLEHHRLRVLVADDNAASRKALQHVLSFFGCREVEAVGGGREVLEKVKSNPYDLIFVDWKMPEMDGLETIRRAQQIACKQPLAFIVCSGSAPGDQPFGVCEEIKRFPWLVKPLQMEKVYSVCAKTLRETKEPRSKEPV